MSVAAAEEHRHSETQGSGFQLLHAIPGRLRVHLPEWSGRGKRRIETHLRQIQGVRSVQANPLTGNILIQYDPTAMNEQAILKEVQAFDLNTTNEPDLEPPPPPVVRDKQGRTVRARIAVRGLDRDPHIARRVLEHLHRYPGVRASVNRLTGRVLVEFTEHEVDLEHLISQVTDLELPEVPEEDRPAYPLDPGPLIQGAFRTIGSTIGLGLLAVRRLVGFQEPFPGSGAALQIASMIGILQGIPPVRYGLRRLLGRTVADLLFNVPGVITLTLAGSALGLAVTAGESLLVLTEVHARRTAWRRFEERAAHATSSQPDAVIRLEKAQFPRVRGYMVAHSS